MNRKEKKKSKAQKLTKEFLMFHKQLIRKWDDRDKLEEEEELSEVTELLPNLPHGKKFIARYEKIAEEVIHVTMSKFLDSLKQPGIKTDSSLDIIDGVTKLYYEFAISDEEISIWMYVEPDAINKKVKIDFNNDPYGCDTYYFGLKKINEKFLNKFFVEVLAEFIDKARKQENLDKHSPV